MKENAEAAGAGEGEGQLSRAGKIIQLMIFLPVSWVVIPFTGIVFMTSFTLGEVLGAKRVAYWFLRITSTPILGFQPIVWLTYLFFLSLYMGWEPFAA